MNFSRIGLMNPAQLREYLQARGLRPLKQFGQNFLHDANLIQWIVQAALEGLPPTPRLLEIGPGLGAITLPLLEAGAHVTAIEKDRGMAEALRERVAAQPELASRFVLHEADALEKAPALDLAAFDRVVGNWPYNISSPLMATFALHTTPPASLFVTLQKEAAARFASPPACKAYGALSVLVQTVYEAQIVRAVPPEVFYPAPDVESSIALFRRRDDLALTDSAVRSRFYDWVRRAFAGRRKKLANTLKITGPVAQLRPEALSPAEWVQLFFEQGPSR